LFDAIQKKNRQESFICKSFPPLQGGESYFSRRNPFLGLKNIFC